MYFMIFQLAPNSHKNFLDDLVNFLSELDNLDFAWLFQETVIV